MRTRVFGEDIYKYLVFLFFLNIGRCRTCKGSVFGSNFVASDVSWDVFFIYTALGEDTLNPASACACLNACFSPCASGVVHVCNGQDCFEGTLDERAPKCGNSASESQFPWRPKKLPACLRNAQATSGGVPFTGCAMHSRGLLNCSECKRPKSHAIEFASAQRTTRTLWLVLPVSHWARVYFIHSFLMDWNRRLPTR